MTKFTGATPTAEELAAIRSGSLGGVILFGWNVQGPTQLRAFTQALNAARAPAARRAGLPQNVLVSVDQEGGAIRNIPFAPPESTQPQLAMSRTDDTKAVGVSTGRAMREVGVSMVLGPVADLAEGPNRTMAGRSFGSDGETVGSFVAANVQGLQLTKVAAVVKHFPGFGASSENSDNGVARIDLPRATLEANDLRPFAAAIDAKVDVIMVSHGIYAGLDSKLPAVLEPKIVTDLLRTQLGFEGVAMTDSMNAKGFRDAWGSTVPAACPVAIAAGIDLVLVTGSLETASLCRRQIVDAVKAGTLPAARVREAAHRVEQLRTRVAPRA